MRRWVLPVIAVLLAAACGGRSGNGSGDDDDDIASETPTVTETPPLHPTVQEAIDDGCTTSIVRPLSEQLIEELNCVEPGSFAQIPADSQIDVGNIFDFLQAPAASSLPGIADERPGVTLTINSALRTLAQQYLLYQWYLGGDCGITLAASPGNSNHESGLALDIGDSTGWRTAFQGNSWTWLGASDPVHYDYAGSGTVNIQGTSVLAFQRLWNLNRPEDPIDEDGLYGPQTEARLEDSPIAGFGISSTCGPSFAPRYVFAIPDRPETCGL